MPSPSPKPKSKKGKEEFGLWVWAVTKISWATHPITFRGSGWEYMVHIEAPSTLECWEGVPSPGGQQEEEHRVVLHVQVEHYQKNSQDH